MSYKSLIRIKIHLNLIGDIRTYHISVFFLLNLLLDQGGNKSSCVM